MCKQPLFIQSYYKQVSCLYVDIEWNLFLRKGTYQNAYAWKTEELDGLDLLFIRLSLSFVYLCISLKAMIIRVGEIFCSNVGKLLDTWPQRLNLENP